jgi:hypothetical protein
MLDEDKLEDGGDENIVTMEEFEKVQQMVSQERANVQKIKTERDANAGQIAALTQQIEDLKTQMNSQADKSDVDMDDLDGSLADPAVVKSLRKQSETIKKLNETLGLMEHKISKHEEQEANKAASKAQEQAVNSILDMCDEEFGTNKYRNDALKMADELVDSGEEEKPSDILSGLRIMRKCYKAIEAKAKEDSDKAPEVVTDKGKGSFSFSESDDYEEGSRDDVLKSMKARVKKNN